MTERKTEDGRRNEADRDGGYQGNVAWQKAMDLVDAVYDASESWPKDEVFGLRSQTRRAAVSVPANIAEGKGRTGSREWGHHLSIAHGSLWETETLLHVARRRKYLKPESLTELLDQSKEVSWLIRGLMKTLR